MSFEKGQRVKYEYDNQEGTITGAMRNNRWQVQFPDGNNLYIPEEKLLPVDVDEDMFTRFSERRFDGIDGIKRVIYKHRLSGTLTNVLYSMSNGSTKFLPHQFVPVTKFLESYTERLLIADEVGLGKTIESMYIWEELRARKNAKRLLIVVPAILRFKWKSDLRQYFGINAQIVNAEKENSGASLYDYIDNTISFPERENFSLIISLEGLRISEKIISKLEECRNIRNVFDLVIIDEAHYLRNSNTKSFKTAELLRDVSDSLLLLSATPIQTGSDNFFNLLRLLSDEEFHDQDSFNLQLSENYPLVKLTSAIDENADISVVREKLNEALSKAAFKNDSDLLTLSSTVDEVMASTDKRVETVANLKSKYFYDSYVTRTRKRDVIENRTERKVFVLNYSLSPEERFFYDRVTEYLKDQGDPSNKFNNFALITRQRQMTSCMPAALMQWRSQLSDGSIEDESSMFFDSFDDEGRIAPSKMQSFDDINLQSLIDIDTKFHKLFELISRLLAENQFEKIVVFTFFRGTAEYLYNQFNKAGIKTLKIIGGMKDYEKEQFLTDFRDKNYNILVSTEVGSEGIDLQFSKYEVNYDLPWNPMRLEQRIGRLDRIGQESPKIYIYNSFCSDTIEDRILKRLYDRIQVFKDCIGDLEEILGNVIQEVELNVFLNNYQTEEDINRIAQQVEQAIANKQLINKDLEIKSGLLSAYQGFILSNIKSAHDNYRRITADELMYTVRDFLNSRFPGSTVERKKEANLASVKLTTEAADSLLSFINKNEKETSTSLCNSHQETICCFGSAEHKNDMEKGHIEIIDINHPLIKWIVNVIKNENCFVQCCSAIQINRKDLPDSLNIREGIYAYYIQQRTAEGARTLNELHYYAGSIDDGSILDSRSSESLLSVSVLHGKSYDTNYLEDTTYHRTIEFAEKLVGSAWDQFEEFEKTHRDRNEDLIKSQMMYICRSTEAKINGYRTTINKLEQEGKQERVIRMWEGKIKHAEEEAGDKIRRLNKKFNCPITCGDVALGILKVE